MWWPIYRRIDQWSKLLLVLNLIDGVATILFLTLGKALEANPLMALAFTLGPVGFMSIKLLIVSTLVVLIARKLSLQYPWLAFYALLAASIPYFLVGIHHIGGLIDLFR